MSPYQTARALFGRKWPVELFDAKVLFYAAHGFLHATPSLFVIARPVPSTAEPSEITNHEVLFDPERCDCWHVDWMAGELGKVWEILPWPLPLASFERRRGGVLELQMFPMDHMRRLSIPHALVSSN